MRSLLRRLNWILAVLLFAMFFATEAYAQSICGNRASIIDKLETAHNERRNAIGIVSDGSVLEVFVSENGGWTIFITMTNGMTCLVAAGTDWQTIPVGQDT